MQTLLEKISYQNPNQLDIDGYHPKATEFLIKLFNKPSENEVCPFNDVDDIMKWLEK